MMSKSLHLQFDESVGLLLRLKLADQIAVVDLVAKLEAPNGLILRQHVLDHELGL